MVRIYEANVLKYTDKTYGNPYSAVKVYHKDKLIGKNTQYGDADQNVYDTISKNDSKYKDKGPMQIYKDKQDGKVKVYMNVNETTRYRDLKQFAD